MLYGVLTLGPDRVPVPGNLSPKEGPLIDLDAVFCSLANFQMRLLE
jgi:hypothetical protein